MRLASVLMMLLRRPLPRHFLRKILTRQGLGLDLGCKILILLAHSLKVSGINEMGLTMRTHSSSGFAVHFRQCLCGFEGILGTDSWRGCPFERHDGIGSRYCVGDEEILLNGTGGVG